jgi:hypothetical protein
VEAGGRAYSITAARPCTGVHVHDPTDVSHWVCTVDNPGMVSTLTRFLARAGPYLRRAQQFSLRPVDGTVPMDPFRMQGVYCSVLWHGPLLDVGTFGRVPAVPQLVFVLHLFICRVHCAEAPPSRGGRDPT